MRMIVYSALDVCEANIGIRETKVSWETEGRIRAANLPTCHFARHRIRRTRSEVTQTVAAGKSGAAADKSGG